MKALLIGAILLTASVTAHAEQWMLTGSYYNNYGQIVCQYVKYSTGQRMSITRSGYCPQTM